MQRKVRVVLVSNRGEVLGQLPILSVAVPWWSEVESVIAAVRDTHGIEVIVLRLLDVTEPQRMGGGTATYLAQIDLAQINEVQINQSQADQPVTCAPWDGTLSQHQNRLSYAEAGGPRRDLAWARDVLVAQGTPLQGRPVQLRTWNLSCLWRLPTAGGDVWMKVLPPFFAHEPLMIEALGQWACTPTLLAHDGNRMLLADIPGEDLYTATLAQRLHMIELLVPIQQQWIDREAQLLAIGARDMRLARFNVCVPQAIQREWSHLSAAEQGTLQGLMDGLQERLHTIEQCGLPNTLLHGDFHAGNVRGSGLAMTILDWADCGVGNPMLDEGAFVLSAPEDWREQIRTALRDAWRQVVPGSDPDTANHLLAPVAAVYAAYVYQGFLDAIEPSEHLYHAADPVACLRRAVRLLNANSL